MMQIEIDANEFKRIKALPNVIYFSNTSGEQFISIGEVLLRYVRTKENVEKDEF